MLTTEQKTAIDCHLRKENWLLNKDLIAELTDHYTEGIEERLMSGVSFEAALREIHTGFGGRKGLLKMEEDYQSQKYHQLNLTEWRLVQSYIHGSRWFVCVGVFMALFWLNTWFGQQDMVQSVSFIALFYVSGSVIGNLIREVILFFRNRHEVSSASLNPSSPLFIGLYSSSVLFLLANKFLFVGHGYGLSPLFILLLNTLLETLCIVYYIAIVVSLRKVYLTNRKTA